jgi:hypothetical protein
LQPGVLRLGLLEDGEVRFGVLLQGEEILVRDMRLGERFGL